MKRVRFDLRLAVAALMALAAGLGVLALTRPQPTVEALVAGAHLPPGVPLGDLNVESRAMSAAPGLIVLDELEALSDHSLAVGIAEGELLLDSLLVPPRADRPLAAAITLDLNHAVQGDLVPGDVVDVYATSAGETTLLAAAVVVTAVDHGSGSLGGREVSLVIAVDDSLAMEIIAATHSAAIDLVRRAR